MTEPILKREARELGMVSDMAQTDDSELPIRDAVDLAMPQCSGHTSDDRYIQGIDLENMQNNIIQAIMSAQKTQISKLESSICSEIESSNRM